MNPWKVHVDRPFITASFSLLWFKAIFVGRGFDHLHPDARAAALLHEQYHLDHHHTELRILMLLTVLPLIFLKRICHAQEFAADAFASSIGFRKGMLQLLAADSCESLLHPSHAARREALSSGSRKGPIASSA